MTSVTVAQLEYADTYNDLLPAQDMLDRLEALVRRRRNEIILIIKMNADLARPNYLSLPDRITTGNVINQAEARLRAIVDEIIEVAGQVYAEYAALEIAQ